MKKAAEFIKENNGKIISTWERNVNAQIEAAQATESLLLRNQLTHVLNDIMKIMDRYENFEDVKKDENFEEIINDSIDHGRHRATTLNYAIKQILQEYMIFHRTLVDLLSEANVYNKEVGNLLNYAVETAMIYSAESFSDSLQDMRDKLVGTIAHDLRNPLTTTYLAMDLINCENDPKKVEMLKNLVKRSMKHSLNLIEGLLDTITVKAGEGITLHFSTTNIIKDIKWVYEEAVEIYSNNIVLDIEAKEINGIFDGAAVRRVLENLVSNGVKYGDKNSKITISALDREEEVVIRIHNWGNPIAEERKKDIFDFMSTSKNGNEVGVKSWGMGLYLVKIVAEAHGGKINLVSNKEEGTTFEIVLKKWANKPGVAKTKLNPLAQKTLTT